MVYEMHVTCRILVNQHAFHYFQYPTSIKVFVSGTVRNGMLTPLYSERLKWLTKFTEKSRERHNHKPQPIPDTMRKRKREESNACKINKQRYVKHLDHLSSPNEVIKMPNRTKNMRTRSKVRLNMKPLVHVVKSTKPHKITITTGPPP